MYFSLILTKDPVIYLKNIKELKMQTSVTEVLIENKVEYLSVLWDNNFLWDLRLWKNSQRKRQPNLTI